MTASHSLLPTPEHTGSSPPEEEALLKKLSPIEYAALQWTVRKGDGLGAGERRQLQEWLDADPRHRDAFADMQSVDDAVNSLPAEAVAQLQASVVLDSAAQQADELLGKSTESAPISELARDARSFSESTYSLPAARAKGFMQRRAWLKAGSMVGVVAVLAAGGWQGWDRWQNQLVFSQRYATLHGPQRSATLPDGSRIALDVTTRADVNLYRNRREVRLREGQAVFEVQADAHRPFIVQAGRSRVTVLGTAFAVRYLPSLGDENVEVSVLRGRVRVAALNGEGQTSQSTELIPGQAIAVSAQGTLGEMTSVTQEDFASWQSGRLNFENVRLDTVLAELARYGDHHVRLQGDEVAQMRVTASIYLKNIDGFLRSLPKALPVNVRKNGDVVLVQQR